VAPLLEWVEWIGLLGTVDPCVSFWILWRPRCDGVFVEPPTLEITSVDSFGESGLDGVVETCVVVISQLARVGTFVEAVSQGRIRSRRHDRHAVGKMSGGSGREGDDGSGNIADG
jgi:hypothetical protein